MKRHRDNNTTRGKIVKYQQRLILVMAFISLSSCASVMKRLENAAVNVVKCHRDNKAAAAVDRLLSAGEEPSESNSLLSADTLFCAAWAVLESLVLPTQSDTAGSQSTLPSWTATRPSNQAKVDILRKMLESKPTVEWIR